MKKFAVILCFTLFSGLQAGWTSVKPNFNYNYVSVHFLNQDTGFVISDHGRVMRTLDGGSSWTNVNSGISTSNDILYSVWFINASTGFIAAGSNKIFRTTNQGSNWNTVTSPAGAYIDLRCVKFLNETTGFIGGTGGIILKTINSGSTWTQVGSVTSPIWDFSFVDATHGWAVGYDAACNATVNGGDNWSFSGYVGNEELYTIAMANVNVGVAAGGTGVRVGLWRTVNGGAKWDTVARPESNVIRKGVFVGAAKGYLACESGNVWVTADTGKTWNVQNTGNTSALNAVYFVNSHVGYAVGTGGAILKTTDGGGNIAVEHFLAPVKATALSVNPNPSTGRTWISFSIARDASVELAVYNAAGAKITSLYRGQKVQGAYRVALNMASCKSGVYFCRLNAAGKTLTKKLMVTR